MKELSLNILDVAENSVKAGAKLIRIEIEEAGGRLSLTITDDGCGMTAEILKRVTDPFYTTRTTRPVGMGLSLLKLAAEQTGGDLEIRSISEKDDAERHGTVVRAWLFTGHIDCVPMGDITGSIITLVQGSPEIDFLFSHKTEAGEVLLDTRELRKVLLEVSLANPDVLSWIKEYLEEQYGQINGGAQ